MVYLEQQEHCIHGVPRAIGAVYSQCTQSNRSSVLKVYLEQQEQCIHGVPRAIGAKYSWCTQSNGSNIINVLMVYIEQQKQYSHGISRAMYLWYNLSRILIVQQEFLVTDYLMYIFVQWPTMSCSMSCVEQYFINNCKPQDINQ